MSLLAKARVADAASYRARPSREVVELAVAFFNGEITGGQVIRAMGLSDRSHSQAWARMSAVLRRAVRHRMVTVSATAETSKETQL